MNAEEVLQYLKENYGGANSVIDVEEDPFSKRLQAVVVSDRFTQGSHRQNADLLYEDLHKRFGSGILQISLAMAVHPEDYAQIIKK